MSHVAASPVLSRRTAVLAGVAVVALLGVVAGVAALGGGSSHATRSASTPTPAPAAEATAVARLVTSVPAAAIAAVGAGSATPLERIGAPPLRAGSAPLVLYVGAEYCPFCAAERWAVVNALGRFGTWTGLGLTTSASADVYPDTPTFTFHGARYTSRYLAFRGVEVASREPQGSGYAPLDALTADENRIASTYDAPPYVPAASARSIPFTDVGGRFVVSGSQLSPAGLHGLSQRAAAEAIRSGRGPVAAAVLGAANRLTAALCTLTGQQPASACGSAAIRSLVAAQGRVRVAAP